MSEFEQSLEIGVAQTDDTPLHQHVGQTDDTSLHQQQQQQQEEQQQHHDEKEGTSTAAAPGGGQAAPDMQEGIVRGSVESDHQALVGDGAATVFDSRGEQSQREVRVVSGCRASEEGHEHSHSHQHSHDHQVMLKSVSRAIRQAIEICQ